MCVGGGNGGNGPSGGNGSGIRTAETGLPLMVSTRSIVSTTKMWTKANRTIFLERCVFVFKATISDRLPSPMRLNDKRIAATLVTRKETYTLAKDQLLNI